VIRDFAERCGHLPGVEPDVVDTLVELKESYFGDPDPARWQAGVLRELLLEVLPRKVTAPDAWFAAVAPTTRAYLTFLQEHRRLARGSDSAAVLLAEVERIADRVLAASRDPRTFGMAKSIFSAMGCDPLAPEDIPAAIEAFNTLPDAQRAAIVDPALGRLGIPLPPIGGEDFWDDGGRWPPLPLTWLPPAGELAAAVRAAPLVAALSRLAAWNGGGHPVTRQEVLPIADARRACADLGLPLPARTVRAAYRIPALHRLWTLATETELLVIDGRTAVRGGATDLITDPGQAPAAVVEWWARLLDTCLEYGLDVTEDPDEDDEGDEDDEEIIDSVDDAVVATLAELYAGAQVPAEGLEEAVVTTVEEDLTAEFWLSADEVREQARRRWAAQLAQLVELGAVAVADGQTSLTPLGRAGLRVLALQDGAEAPVVGDPATLEAATLLQALTQVGELVGRPMLAAWAGVRSPGDALSQLLDAARAGSATTRMMMLVVAGEALRDHARGAGRPAVEALRDDPVLGLCAHLLLADAGQPVELPGHLRQWAALESVGVAAESDALDDEDTAAKVWELVDEDGDLDSAWRSPHPQLIEILEAIAARHPRGRARKAAKKALFKARRDSIR
jgi:hypothetical protein